MIDKKELEEYIDEVIIKIKSKYVELDFSDKKKEIFDKFINSEKTMNKVKREINDLAENAIRKYLESKQSHYELNELFDCRISNNTLHIHVVPKSVKEDISKMGIKGYYDYVEKMLVDALYKIPKILNEPQNKNINNVFAVSPLLKMKNLQNLFSSYGFETSMTESEKFSKMFHDRKIGQAIISRDKFLYIYEKERNIEFKKGFDTDTIVKGKIFYIEPNPQDGFKIGYGVFIPETCNNNTTMIYHACNTGIDSNSYAQAQFDAKKGINEDLELYLAYSSGQPLLVPFIPRVDGYYTQGLTDKVIYNDSSDFYKINTTLSDDDKKKIVEQCENLPEQLFNIVEDAKQFLKEQGINVTEKIDATGYSAGSKQVMKLAKIKPELFDSIYIGGTSGLGLEDLENTDIHKFSQIKWNMYIGSIDFNNPLETIVENGEEVSKYPEFFTTDKIKYINSIYGTNNNIDRFNKTKSEYIESGIAKEENFKICDGWDHDIFIKKDNQNITWNIELINWLKRKTQIKMLNRQKDSLIKNTNESAKSLLYSNGFINIIIMSLILLFGIIMLLLH